MSTSTAASTGVTASASARCCRPSPDRGPAGRNSRRSRMGRPRQRRVWLRQRPAPRAGRQLPAEPVQQAHRHARAHLDRRPVPHLRRDGERDVRPRHRLALAVPVPRRGRRLRVARRRHIGLTGANGTLPLYNFSGTSGGFAAQAIAGLSFPVPNVPGLSLTAEYRFLAVFGGASYDGTVIEPGPGGRPLPPLHQRLSLNNEFNNGVLLGIRYAFGVQPPPPPPAPAPIPVAAPTRSYLVFFDWDKATLTTARAQIIREAADAFDQGPIHADRGERLHRHLGHAALQPGPVDPPGRGGGGRTGPRRRAAQRDHDPGLRRDASAGAHRPPACASRRTAASRSSSAEPASAGDAPPVRARRRAAGGARRRRLLGRHQRRHHDLRPADRARHPVRPRAEAGSRRVCARRRPIGRRPVRAGRGVPVRRRLADRLPRAVSLRRRGPGRARLRHRHPRLPGLSAGPVSRLPAGLRARRRVGVGARGGAWRRIDAVRDGPLGRRVQRDDAGAG